MAIHNVMEILVEQKLDNLLKKEPEVCKCGQCKDDIKCIALNKLPVKYVSSDKGELFSRVDQRMHVQNNMDIEFAVIRAIEAVKQRPRHSPPIE